MDRDNPKRRLSLWLVPSSTMIAYAGLLSLRMFLLKGSPVITSVDKFCFEILQTMLSTRAPQYIAHGSRGLGCAPTQSRAHRPMRKTMTLRPAGPNQSTLLVRLGHVPIEWVFNVHLVTGSSDHSSVQPRDEFYFMQPGPV